MKNSYEMMKLDRDLNDRFEELLNNCLVSGTIDQNLYETYDVKRGLRDSNGRGVLTGLTEVSDVTGYTIVNGVKEASEGHLYYHGYDIQDLVGKSMDKRFAFEEITYLLLFGSLPTEDQLAEFIRILDSMQELSGQFVRDVIMKGPSENIMNGLMKSVLNIYSFDTNPDDISVNNVLRQSLQLIAKMPLISVYSYYAYRHFEHDESLIIKPCVKGKSTAENILHILRADGEYTKLEARTLDVALVLHAEHGGGNNSTFTNHVVTTSGTDTYSAVAASIASLKGPRHGGANIKVQYMFEDLKANVEDVTDKAQIKEYLMKVLEKKAFDHSGLIYGIGHAVYTLSDPRAKILKKLAEKLAKEKGMEEEFKLYETVEKVATKLLSTRYKHIVKPICANVDFYSGFIYTMLGIPKELFTPLFAISRISGWSAHRLEEIVNNGKIIRPAYKYIGTHREYIDIKERVAVNCECLNDIIDNEDD
ncbi:MAG: citrate/2-methylcitrate synthase [Lachnospiraceae bacterium]|nr:citrate/2-methylcitrate synthase [Lachnospiraceae bacterium]